MKLLKFAKGNAKLEKTIAIFSIPAGHTCPGAKECLAKANRHTGKITDGPEALVRCSAASEEWRPAVRDARWYNLGLLLACKTPEEMTALQLASLPSWADAIRLHGAGDFYSQRYFDSWLSTARQRPDLLVYGYTKSLPFWSKREIQIPANVRLTASKGSRWDHEIDAHGWKFAQIVLDYAEAAALGLEVDHDDSHAMNGMDNFALAIHGTQRAGTPAARAWNLNRATHGYSRKRKVATAA